MWHKGSPSGLPLCCRIQKAEGNAAVLRPRSPLFFGSLFCVAALRGNLEAPRAERASVPSQNADNAFQGPHELRFAATWRCHEQSGHPFHPRTQTTRSGDPGLPAIEAATAATSGSGSNCGRSHRCGVGERPASPERSYRYLPGRIFQPCQERPLVLPCSGSSGYCVSGRGAGFTLANTSSTSFCNLAL